MPPRGVKRPSLAAATKKKAPQKASTTEANGNNEKHLMNEERHELSPIPTDGKKEKEFVQGDTDRLEKLDLEYNDPQSEVEEDGGGTTEQEEDLECDEDDEKVDGDYPGKQTREVEEDDPEEEEVDEVNYGDEQSDGVEVYEEEHHDVVRERRKRKEFEVFVGGLDRDATENDLRKVFGQVGEITEIRLMKNPNSQKNKGFGFIQFATVEQARRALNELKHPMVNGKRCGVAPSQDSDTLFVGNISKTWTKEALKEKLAQYGVDKIEDLTLVEDHKNEGLNRGFAFLDFSSRADALEACKRLQGRDVVFGTDRTARVAFADTFIEPDDEIMSQVRTIFVDGLPAAWDEDRVKVHLKRFGRIEKVELARNMPAAKRNDFGFITFDTHDAAVHCVETINDSEIGDGDKKVKVRARLSRPRQRGKSSKHARGGYLVNGSNRAGVDPRRFTGGYNERRITTRMYESNYKSSLGPKDRRPTMKMGPDWTGPRGQFASPPRSDIRRFPEPPYGKSISRKSYIIEDDSFVRPAGFAREKHSYRDAYASRQSAYVESSRSISRGGAARGPPVLYDDDYSYGRYVERERPSTYRDSHSRDYPSFSGTKRPYSAIEESHPRYAESSVRHSRSHVDYGGRSSGLVYGDKAYGSDTTRVGRNSRADYDGSSRRSEGHPRGFYEPSTTTSSIGYRKDEIRRRDAEDMYSNRDYMSRDYMPSRSDFRTDSYSSAGPRMNDGSVRYRSSDSYY